MGSPAGAAFVALGLVLPALLLQDSWRYGFFAGGQGRKAFVNDAVWAVALIPAMLIAARYGSVFAFVIAWGASAAAAAVYGCLQTGIRPRPGGITEWLRQQRDLGLRYMVENVSISGAAQLRMYGLGAIAGLADVGAVRGAQLLLGPFLALLMGTSLFAVPEAARVLRRAPRRLPHFCALLGGSQAIAGMLWGIALLVLLPDRSAGTCSARSGAAAALIIPTTLGDGREPVRRRLAGLRALGAARAACAPNCSAATAYVSGGVIGAVLGGAAGSAWGVAAATLRRAVAWWQLLAAMGAPTGTTPSPSTAARPGMR